MFRLFRIILIVLLIVVASAFAQQDRGMQVVADLSGNERIALVIGNSSYSTAPLTNPVNDATDLGAALRNLGFEVFLYTDQNRSQFRDAVRRFGDKLRTSRGVGLFFYAGHGIQVNGENYLIPIGADIQREYDVSEECVGANYVLSAMEDARNPLNIVILDACRNNPYSRSWRSAERGLAQIGLPPRGTKIIYSAKPGMVAADGEGRNSPFTAQLIELIRIPNLEINMMISQLAIKLIDESHGMQEPWSEGIILGQFYFVQGKVAAEQPTIKPNEKPKTKITSEISPDMIFVEGGTFQMGSSYGDEDEKPIHSVSISGFYIGKYEVTFNEYDEFCTATKRYKPSTQGWGANRRPVINVTWFDAIDYCNWKSQKEGLTPCYTISESNVTCNFQANGYRLPTEAEWEYAARGGNESRGYIYAGSNNISDVGWYSVNSGSKTHIVGEKKENELGIFDMSGNVKEWCWDWWSDNFYSESISKDPKGPSDGILRIIRGGSYSNEENYHRTASRNRNDARKRFNLNGFRLVRIK